MKQRIISLTVCDSEGNIKFEKSPCSPQDVMAALPLFEGDDVVFTVKMTAVDITPNQQN